MSVARVRSTAGIVGADMSVADPTCKVQRATCNVRVQRAGCNVRSTSTLHKSTQHLARSTSTLHIAPCTLHVGSHGNVGCHGNPPSRLAAKGSVMSTRNNIRNSESPKLYSNMP